MNKGGIVVAVVVVAAGVAGAWWSHRPEPSTGLELAGVVEARDVQVGSLVGGRVATVDVVEGATVAPGQTIVTFETEILDRQVGEQRARVAEAAANLERARKGPRNEELRRAEIELRAAETDRRRIEALRKDGVAPQQQLDAAVVRESTAAETFREKQRGSRIEDLDAAAAVHAREKERLAGLERQRAELVVKTPVAGVVESIDLRPGDLVPANQPVATILEPDQLWVRVFVPEPKLGLVRLGQDASVEVDTFPGRTFPAKVVEIRQKGEYTPRNVQTLDQRSELVFGVKLSFGTATGLRPGMSATVRLAR